MSAEATFWAWEQDVKSTHKLVLLALANCHNESTGQCNPSVSYINKKTGLNRKTVMTAMRFLEEGGFISTTKKFGAGNHYVLSTSTEIGTSPKNGTSTKIGTTTSPKNGQDQYQNRDTNLKETKRESKTPRKTKTRIPENFALTLHMRDLAFRYWSTKNRTDLTADDEFHKFCAHHRSKGTKNEDWESAWVTWYSNAVTFTRPPGGNYGKSDRVAGVIAATIGPNATDF